jgi:stress-induced-phosphoprotein 1
MDDKARGNELYQRQNYEAAKLAYSDAIKVNPNDPSLFTNRAACHMELGKFLKAVKDCDKAIALNPSWMRAYIRKTASLKRLRQSHCS